MSKQRQPKASTPSDRSAAKPDRATPAASRGPGAVKADAPDALRTAIERLEAKVRELKRERDLLSAELDVARSQIAALDLARRDAINRIDWVLDSLHTLLNEDTE